MSVSDRAVALLPSRSAQGTNTPGIVRALGVPLQALEDEALAVLAANLLDNAEGERLEFWGAVVGLAREGRSDVDYRAAIRLEVRVNRSEGTPRDIVDVAKLAAPSAARVFSEAARSIHLEIDGLPGANGALSALRRTRAGGVEMDVVFLPPVVDIAGFAMQALRPGDTSGNGDNHTPAYVGAAPDDNGNPEVAGASFGVAGSVRRT